MTAPPAKAWVLMTDAEQHSAWHDFHRRFAFSPSYRGVDPGIVEPKQSTTYDISHAYGDSSRYLQLTKQLCHAYTEAFRVITPVDSSVLVLDWQHNCYNFFPHQEFPFRSEDDWPIPALPNGGYYIFLSRDMNCGAFGHPWRETICIWGPPFQNAIVARRPTLLTRPIRRSGKAL